MRNRSALKLAVPLLASLALVASACGSDEQRFELVRPMPPADTGAPAGTDAPAGTEAPAGSERPGRHRSGIRRHLRRG